MLRSSLVFSDLNQGGPFPQVIAHFTHKGIPINVDFSRFRCLYFSGTSSEDLAESPSLLYSVVLNLKRPNSTSAHAIIDFGWSWARYSRFQVEIRISHIFPCPGGSPGQSLFLRYEIEKRLRAVYLLLREGFKTPSHGITTGVFESFP